MEKVQSVEDYLHCINEMIVRHPSKIYRYRGEAREHSQSNIPNVFRHKQELLDNPSFERSVLDSLRSRNLSDGSTCLELAIDAQHGGFPTRLLDVSSNSLVALYFAIKTYKEKEYDGNVYMFFFEEIYPAVSDKTINLYDAILDGDEAWRTEGIFKYNHRLIGHYARNKRISAQQGEFILFQGNEFEQIPDHAHIGITIDGSCKEKIKAELKNYFGIDESYVYPEIEHASETLIEQSKHYKYSPNTLEDEIEFFIKNVNCKLDAYEDKIIEAKKSKKESLELIIEIEYYLKEISYLLSISFRNLIITNPKLKDTIHNKDIELSELVNGRIQAYENHLSKLGITISSYPYLEVDYEII